MGIALAFLGDEGLIVLDAEGAEALLLFEVEVAGVGVELPAVGDEDAPDEVFHGCVEFGALEFAV